MQTPTGKPEVLHVEPCIDKSMVMSCGYLHFFLYPTGLEKQSCIKCQIPILKEVSVGAESLGAGTHDALTYCHCMLGHLEMIDLLTCCGRST